MLCLMALNPRKVTDETPLPRNREGLGCAVRPVDQWWDETGNFQWGCNTPGCLARCWAEPMAVRMAANPVAPPMYRQPGIIENGRWTGRTFWDQGAMRKVFHTINHSRKPKVWALGFMTDLFCPASSLGMLDCLALEIGASSRRQTIVLTTKNPEELLAWQRRYFPDGLPANVVSLLSLCTQEEADRKIPIALRINGRLGLHCEPMLEGIDLHSRECGEKGSSHCCIACLGGIEWLACGPENGPGKRPFSEDWARDLRAQCRVAGVRFFYKAGLLDGQANEGIDG